jgi:hypothetical protein
MVRQAFCFERQYMGNDIRCVLHERNRIVASPSRTPLAGRVRIMRLSSTQPLIDAFKMLELNVVKSEQESRDSPISSIMNIPVFRRQRSKRFPEIT